MLSKKFPRLSANNTLFSIILIVNAFVWLSCTSKMLREIVNMAAFTDYETLMIWGVNFCGAAFSILAGAFLADRFHVRVRFLLVWTLFGIISSIAPLFIDTTTIDGILVVSSLFSVSLGLGLPVCMAEFADNTVVEKRGRLGGITFLFIMVLGAFTANLITENIMTSLLFLACWKGLGLIAFFFTSSDKRNVRKGYSVTFISILKERSFILYAIPWTMFSLVNYLGASISVKIHGEEFIYLSMIVEFVLAGVFAIVGGFLSDIIGRKRITIVGFIMLGLGYAVLGIYPLTLFCWYFYIMIDGIAWGILYVVFITTIWGDLAYGRPSEKYYALGSLPYLISSFLHFTVGPFIADTISPYAIFSFASFFLFLAVLPLMFAPETLPEKRIRERELRQYIEKAKKIKGKYT
jgi:MFS family permease